MKYDQLLHIFTDFFIQVFFCGINIINFLGVLLFKILWKAFEGGILMVTQSTIHLKTFLEVSNRINRALDF